MSHSNNAAMNDLFGGMGHDHMKAEILSEGAVLLCGFAASKVERLIDALDAFTTVAPFRHMITPGGYTMSVAMTNCGEVGWVTDRSGYRYDCQDPETGDSWPSMPAVYTVLAADAANAGGYPGFAPDSCLINRYAPGARLSLHQDKDECDFTAPIVSVSLGLPTIFLFGGLKRSDRPRRIRLESGDVVVWGGPARLAYHGIAPLADGDDTLTGKFRINLTFRKAL